MSEKPRPANFRDLLAVIPQEPFLVAPAVVRFQQYPRPDLGGLLSGKKPADQPSESDADKAPFVIDSIRESLPPFPGARRTSLLDSLLLTPIRSSADPLRSAMRRLYLRVMDGAAFLTDSPVCGNPLVLLGLIDLSAARRNDDIVAGRVEVLRSLGLDRVLDWSNERFVEQMRKTDHPASFDGLVQLGGKQLMGGILAGLGLPREYEFVMKYQPDPHITWYVERDDVPLAEFAISYVTAIPEVAAAPKTGEATVTEETV